MCFTSSLFSSASLNNLDSSFSIPILYFLFQDLSNVSCIFFLAVPSSVDGDVVSVLCVYSAKKKCASA